MDSSFIFVTEDMTTILISPETYYGYEDFEISAKVVDDQEPFSVKFAYISQTLRDQSAQLWSAASVSA